LDNSSYVVWFNGVSINLTFLVGAITKNDWNMVMTLTREEVSKVTQSLNPMIEEFTDRMAKEIVLKMDQEINIKKIVYLEYRLHQIITRCIDARWKTGFRQKGLFEFASEVLSLACYNEDEYRNMK
jgi:hypothetical protein